MKKQKQVYAPCMYLGEEKRDASDNIKGYIYQDILAINIILSSSPGDIIFVEWCEDIYVENDNDIFIYQVKYYQKTKNISQTEICKNLFCQYIKYKLYECEGSKKQVRTFLMYYCMGKPTGKDDIKGYIKRDNELKKINKEMIKEEYKNCSDVTARQEVLLSKVASNELANSFYYELLPKETIELEISNLKDALYKKLLDGNANILFTNYNENQIKDILFSVSIQFVQESYYNKSRYDYKEREMTKEMFIKYVEKVIRGDKDIENERIVCTILYYIYEAFTEWIKDIDDEENATIKTYIDIYCSTRDFFKLNMQDKENRYRFINAINNSSELFNKETILSEEHIRIYELKNHIIDYVQIIWKIMYDIDVKDFGDLMYKDIDCYTVNFPNDNARNSLVIPNTIGGRKGVIASRCLERVYKMKNKPDKWYCYELEGGRYSYSFKVDRIKEACITENNINKIKNEDENFHVKCLRCVNYDIDGIGEKDDIKFLFTTECKERCKE